MPDREVDVTSVPSSPWQRVATPSVTIGVLSLATVALHLHDPHQRGSWGLCPLYAATGIYCPGCGGLRAVNDLTYGHVGAALSSNVLVTLGIPVATILLGLWWLRSWRGQPALRLRPEIAAVWWPVLAATAVAFTILRNTPAGAWLAP